MSPFYQFQSRRRDFPGPSRVVDFGVWRSDTPAGMLGVMSWENLLIALPFLFVGFDWGLWMFNRRTSLREFLAYTAYWGFAVWFVLSWARLQT